MSHPCPCTLYRLQRPDGEDLGLVPHPVPNLDAGDLVVDGRFAFWEVLSAQALDGCSTRTRTLIVVEASS